MSRDSALENIVWEAWDRNIGGPGCTLLSEQYAVLHRLLDHRITDISSQSLSILFFGSFWSYRDHRK